MSKQKNEIIFGFHPIIELLKAKRRKLYTIYTTSPAPKRWHALSKNIPQFTQIQYTTRAAINKLTGTDENQGIAASVGPFQIRKKFFEPKKQPFLVMLDGIQDPQNLGAVLRSAHCTNVSGVIITQKNSAPINGTVIKASAGLAEHMDIIIAGTARGAIQQLKDAGYSIYLTTVDKSVDATKVDYTLPLCVVIGSEGFGVSQNILGSGQHITLPQRHADMSYNASVAAGIMMFMIATKQDLL